MIRPRTGLLAVAVSLAVIAVGPAAIAAADPPALSISSPSNGSSTSDPTLSFTGTTSDFLEEEPLEEVLQPAQAVEVNVYTGDEASSGQLLETLSAQPTLGGAWSVKPSTPLASGTYTVQAEQPADDSEEPANAPEVGVSSPVTFTIDTTPPQVTLTSPASGSSSSSPAESLSGAAGTESGDAPAITIRLFAGESTGPQALEALEVPASGASWSATFGGLAPGTYTARATQHDAAGNTGTSGAVTFAIVAAPGASPPPPPVASFSWIPAAPRTGESVSFVSSSTDAGSPITGFAWSLTAAGSFAPGKPVLATSFATPGSHVVRLLVTDAGGRTSLATQTVPVGESSHPLMQPFPIVRIVGSVTSFGARVRLLSVQAPLSAQVLVTCKGRGCKTKSESRFASASSAAKGKPGAVTLAFQHFERALRAGVVLQIRVSKPGEIGKFTSFTIRRNRPPTRTDRCLMPTTSTPILCPST